jgi:hypothetical protein
MSFRLLCLIFVVFLALTETVRSLPAQTMSMPGMENTAGFLSSGTSIQPRVTSESEPMIHTSLGNWTFMFHGNAFVVDTQQSGPRGRDKFYSANWMMPMVTRQFGPRWIAFRMMISLDPVTVTKRQYPLLFQSGETAYGEPIVDGQHPHELLMEISGRYDYRFGDSRSFFLYGGPVAEPALGPTGFPHRASASENPLAALAHHQQDSTHISNSVLTLGFVLDRLQLEGSTFHGREPNENRWNIDGGEPDSFAARVSAGITDQLSGQFSAGRINNREALHPTDDTFRMTASLSHQVRFSSGHVASSLIWGRNKDLPGHDAPRIFNGYTLESTVNFGEKNWVWTRIENIDRDATLLGEQEEDPIGRIQAYTFGYERDLPIATSALRIGLGAQTTVYGVPPQLKTAYGNRPAGFSVFLRIRPKGNLAEHMRLMHGH